MTWKVLRHNLRQMLSRLTSSWLPWTLYWRTEGKGCGKQGKRQYLSPAAGRVTRFSERILNNGAAALRLGDRAEQRPHALPPLVTSVTCAAHYVCSVSGVGRRVGRGEKVVVEHVTEEIVLKESNTPETKFKTFLSGYTNNGHTLQKYMNCH